MIFYEWRICTAENQICSYSIFSLVLYFTLTKRQLVYNILYFTYFSYLYSGFGNTLHLANRTSYFSIFSKLPNCITADIFLYVRSWITDGIKTTIRHNTVICTTPHLTSFAVLIDSDLPYSVRYSNYLKPNFIYKINSVGKFKCYITQNFGYLSLYDKLFTIFV